MPKRTPIRIIVPKLDMSRNDHSTHSSTPQSSAPSRRTHRTHDPPHAERRHRHEHSRSQSANPTPGIPTPSLDAVDIPQPVASPPFRGGPSPGGPELLPGGGVQIPQGFRFSQPDYGHYRRRSSQGGDPENARVLGRMGLGVFRGLRKIPAAIVKAGRSYGPRNQETRDMSPVPETDHEADPRPGERPGRVLQESPIQDDVETYMEPEEEEAHAREEQLLYDYIQRKRMTRDRAFRKRTRQQTSRSARNVSGLLQPEQVPAALVPGAHTPAASVAAASQIDHSQAGHSDVPPAAPEVRLEAEEMRREREYLEQAQQRERARKIYAADAVRQQPLSTISSERVIRNFPRRHRSASDHRPPRLHTHVFSRWSAERDTAGRRQENRPDEDLTHSSLLSRILRFMQQIQDMPWVAERVAADYIPGGVKPISTSSRRYISSPGSDGTYSSPRVESTVSGSPLPVRARRAASTPGSRPSGQSWYTQEDILVLPVGVDPPPGFIPYPFPVPGVTPSAMLAEGEGAASTSSHTHIEAPPPAPASPPAGSSTSGPGYLDGESYQFVPAEGSKTGRPYMLVPMGDGRHQPLVAPGMRKQPAYMYSHPGSSNFMPVAR